MGKVFTPEELERGHVPGEGDHLAAARYIADQLFFEQEAFAIDFLPDGTRPYTEPSIIAGLIHGSVTHGTANKRSDLDVVMIYRPITDDMDTIWNVFDVTRNNYHVPIEANLVTLPSARARTHGLDPLFLSYLRRAQANPEFSWNWPIDLLIPSNDEIEDQPLSPIVERYLAAKASSFSKALVAEEIDVHRLQRALELPKNLGRKVLSMGSGGRFMVEDHPEGEVSELFLDFCRRQRGASESAVQAIVETTAQLLDHDAYYWDLLNDVIDHGTPIQQYRDWLEGREPREIVKLALTLSLETSKVLEGINVPEQQELSQAGTNLTDTDDIFLEPY